MFGEFSPRFKGVVPITALSQVALGTTQATALYLDGQNSYQEITTAASNTGVRLPEASIGGSMIVNNRGANALKVYPSQGESINKQSVNAAFTIPVKTAVIFNVAGQKNWYSTPSFQGGDVATTDATSSLTIGANTVTNAKLAQMANLTAKGNVSGGTANPSDLTATQITANLVNTMVGDSGAGGTKGLVPAPPAGSTAAGDFLAANATWLPAFQLTGSYNTGSTVSIAAPKGLCMYGRLAFLAGLGTQQFNVVDFTNPSSPVIIAQPSIMTSHQTGGIDVQFPYAYVTEQTDNVLRIVDINNPKSPTSAATINIGGTNNNPTGIKVRGRYAYVTCIGSSGTIKIIDVAAQAIVGSVSSTSLGTNGSIDVQDNYAYVGTGTGVQVYDISDPANPTVKGSYSTGASVQQVVVQQELLYAVTSTTFYAINVSNPSSLSLTGSVSLSQSGGNVLSINGQQAFVGTAGTNPSHIDVINVSNPASLSISYTITQADPNLDAILVQGQNLYYSGGGFDHIGTIALQSSGYVQGLEAGSIDVSNLAILEGFTAGYGKVGGGFGVGKSLYVNQKAYVQGNISVGGSATSASVFTGFIFDPATNLAFDLSTQGQITASESLIVSSNLTVSTTLTDSTSSTGSIGDIYSSSGAATSWQSPTTLGIPKVVASVFEKAETGSDANVLTYAVGASDEFLIVQIAVDVSALTGTSVVATMTWQDSNNATQTSSVTLTGIADGTIIKPINAFTGTSVVVSTVFIGISTAYNISAVITRLL